MLGPSIIITFFFLKYLLQYILCKAMQANASAFATRQRAQRAQRAPPVIFRQTFVPTEPDTHSFRGGPTAATAAAAAAAFPLFSSSRKIVLPADEEHEAREVEIHNAGWSYFEIVDYGAGMSDVRDLQKLVPYHSAPF